MKENSSDIVQRKRDHIDVVLQRDVGFGRLTTGFEAVRFVHCALPEIDLADIDVSATFFGKAVRAPFLISSMTGGPDRAASINLHLAEAAEQLGIAFAVGSQRIALEEAGAGGIHRDLRRVAPSIPLIGNLGAAQITGPKGVEAARRAIDMIDADGLFIHLNPLQEAVQSRGDTDWRNVLSAIGRLATEGLPIAVKEVGFGLSAEVVRQLTEAGVRVVDVAGAGGTNWARVEGYRPGGEESLAAAFTEWGIPTARALIEARRTAPKVTLIASGGIRDGVEAAKAIRLGANMVGQAAGTLAKAVTSTDAVVGHFSTMIQALRLACFATGSVDLAALAKAPLQDDKIAD